MELSHGLEFERLQFAEETEHRKPSRVLIVEDDFTQEPIWNYIVERACKGSQIIWATSEPEAESLIMESYRKGEEFNLVISDIFLSGSKTGIDLWNRFYHLLHSRMIVTSGIEYNKFIRFLGPDGAQPLFLKKPLKTSECIEAVYSFLGKKAV